jgi:asparagine synthase (glutamine-hydrolysing)
MCGIAGLFRYRNVVSDEDVRTLLEVRAAMRSRGPDGEGLWRSEDGATALAHLRLAIIDLSPSGAQPMRSDDGRFTLTFNGEIYNYVELRERLAALGHTFRTKSDSEVLLHLYRERGADMVHELRGMYAFAVYDSFERRLFLARDPFGIKPLYFAESADGFWFASQVKALLKVAAVDRAEDPAGHVGFFLWGHLPEPYTLYRGIRSLPAGSTLLIEATGRKQSRRYFSVGDELRAAAARASSASTRSVQDRLREALLESVRYHLVSDVPVGLFLSSGLDSTTLAALASEVAGTRLRTVTLGFAEYKDTANNEVPLAEMMARQLGSDHETRWISKEEFLADRDHLLEAMDQPTIDGVNSYFVCKAAKQAGLKVAISGLGGDEIFGGYPSFRQIPLATRLLAGFRYAPGVGKVLRELSAPIVRRLASPKYASLFEYGGTYAGAYLLRRGLHMPWELEDMLGTRMLSDGLEELRTLQRLDETVRGVEGSHAKITALETTWYMRNQLLRDTDWASMAHSLEVRVPLVDVEFFRAAAQLLLSPVPPNKRTMASTPRAPLPRAIMHRSKSGFSVPITTWVGGPQGARPWSTTIYREFTGSTPATGLRQKPTIVVFRIGQLGDTLVAMPAIEAIRKRFPEHRLLLLTDRQKTGYVSSWDVLRATGWFDDVIHYRVGTTWQSRLSTFSSLLFRLRRIGVDQLFNLAPNRTRWQVRRDRWYFSGLAGVRNYHPPGSARTPERGPDGRLPRMEPEWSYLLHTVDETARADKFNLNLPHMDEDEALRVASASGIELGSPMLAVGPGSKMPAKRWPTESFAELGARLQRQGLDLQLVVLGGAEDVAVGTELCKAWGRRAFCLAGKLTAYGSAAILKRCLAYVGNDSGAMHLAGMVGTPCLALFSARDYPGKWEPFGADHVLIRHDDVPCSGCMLQVCPYDNKCLRLISVDEVERALSSVLAQRMPRPASIASVINGTDGLRM